jgi:thermostable 8-oxoguanine DNA glycosylase
MTIPKDPVMRMSYLNTKLRDEYPSLEELCKSMDLSQEEIRQQLAGIGYRYDESRNQFVPGK